MSEFPSQSELVREQLVHDAHQRMLQRAADIAEDGSKGLAVLNSGAALTMLAFFGSLAEKAHGPLAQFKSFGLSALAAFLLGAFLGSVAFFYHYQQTIYEHYEDKQKAKSARLSFGLLMILSAFLFFVGAVLAGIGLMLSF